MKPWLVVAWGVWLLAGYSSWGEESSPEKKPAESGPTAPVQEVSRKVLLAHYMPWYEAPPVRPAWGAHWTGWKKEHNPEKKDRQGLPDLYSHLHPLIGPYDSSDPDVLECQLLQMKLAGIDGVIADWYGHVDFHDYGSIHQNTQALFRATAKLGMKFCALFEDRTIETMVNDKLFPQEKMGEHLAAVVDWCRKEWFGQDHYLRGKDGRPVLLNFGPIYVKDPAVWKQALGDGKDRPELFCLHHLWKSVGADGGYTWVHFEAWKGAESGGDKMREELDRIYRQVSPDPHQVIVSALPGFRDVYEKSYGHIPFLGGDTLRDTLAVCMEGPWPVVQLATWNDYGEGTVLEPTFENGYRALEVLQEARQKESGGKFPFTSGDLRLPAQLFALRKKQGSDSAALDRISQLLQEGKCMEARQALAKQAAVPSQPSP